MSAEQLKQFVSRYEILDAEKQDISDQQKQVLAEAKATGYDTKALREVLRRRKMDRDSRAELDSLTELYEQTLTDQKDM